MRIEPHANIGRTESRKNIPGLVLWMNDAGAGRSITTHERSVRRNDISSYLASLLS